MAENPIKASDLFEDDGTIQKLIDQLSQLDKNLSSVRDNIVTSAKKVKDELSKANIVQDAGQKVTQQAAEEAQKLAEVNSKVTVIQRELEKVTGTVNERYKEYMRIQRESKTLAQSMAKFEEASSSQKSEIIKEVTRLRFETQALNRETKLTVKENMSASGSYDKLAAQHAKMTMQLRAMSDEQRYNTEEGRRMESQSKAIYNEMIRMQMATGPATLKVGSYTEALRESNLSLREMTTELMKLKSMSLEGKTEAEIKDIEKAIGETTDKMKKYKMEVEAYGMDTYQMISGAASGIIASIQGMAGALNVLGIEGEALKKVQNNMLSMIAITQALERMERLYHQRVYQTLILRTKNTAVMLKELAVKKWHAAQTWLNVRAQQAQAGTTVTNTVATGAAAAATTGATVATGAWTIAVRAFSTAVYNIPVLGWLLAILGAIIAATVALVRHWDKVTGVFRSMGQWLGIVKDTADEAERAAEKIKAMNLEMKLSERAIDIATKASQRQIDLMKAMGASADQVAKKERDLLTAQISNAKHRMQLARDMGDWDVYNDMRESIEDLEHDLKIHDLSEANRQKDEKKRNQERAQAYADANKKRVIDERKASKELAVIMAKHALDQAKTEKEKEYRTTAVYSAMEEQMIDAAKIELENADLTASQRKLIEAKLGIDLLALRAEQSEAMLDQEKRRFDLLAEITNSDEQKVTAALQQAYQDRLTLAGEDVQLRLAIEKWYQDQKDAIKSEQTKKDAETELKAFEAQLDLEESRFNVEKRTQAEQQSFRLKQDIQYYQKRLELQAKYGGIMTEGEIEIVQNMITALQRELDEMGQGDKGDFWSKLGINISPEKRQAIQQSTQYALNQISQIIQARNQQAQAAVQAAQSETDAAKAAYEKEAELMRKGEANRAAAAEMEMRSAEQRQKQAEQLGEKERKRAARLEGLAQAGNLVTASTKIWAQAGPYLAIPLIALMWASFYAQRRQAAKATKETYGTGHFETVDTGGSHASGNDVSFPIDRRVERGESWAVFNKRATRRYGADNLEKMVGDINTLTLESNLGMLADGKDGGVMVDMSGVERKLGTLISQGSQRTYIDNKGRLVIEKGNTKRIYG